MFALSVPNTFMLGVVGSTAYGLATPASDIDRVGVYAVPTEQLHGLDQPVESVRDENSDTQLHEVGKFCRLALTGNPSVNEMLWLRDYEILWPIGEDLVALRSAFLSAPKVRGAYLTYAVKQLERMRSPASQDNPDRAAKNARHVLRLVNQGLELYTTGALHVRLRDPERYHEFGRLATTTPGVAHATLQRAIAEFDAAKTVLPDAPDRERVDKWLKHARTVFWNR